MLCTAHSYTFNKRMNRQIPIYSLLSKISNIFHRKGVKCKFNYEGKKCGPYNNFDRIVERPL